MKLIVADTYDQVNGVSTTYKNIMKLAEDDLHLMHPGLFKWKSSEIYPEVQLCVEPVKVWNAIKKLNPERIHIATEGMMGLVARTYCKWYGVPYTTAYHTKFPDFMKELLGIPMWATWAFVRWFHKGSSCVLTTTTTMCMELEMHGFKNVEAWTRGVDTEALGEARTSTVLRTKPILISAGRVSKEKNLDVFCQLDTDRYQLRVVGDGPYRAELEAKYPQVEFVGYKHGRELGQAYADGDVFVFTSLTDTFGLVMIEAMSMGTPVAAFDVTGPVDAVTQRVTGHCYNNLNLAIKNSLMLNRREVAEFARNHWTWDHAYNIFINHLNEA
jgi:glycosyltransferase involved in cell wall biosynthesis